jgi:hypothetical protein
MIHPHESSRLGRLWTAVIEASVAAVAIHYAAPWTARTASRCDGGRNDGPACAA